MIFLEKSFRFAENLATGFLKATRFLLNVQAGITEKKTMAELLSTCFATGDMFWIIYLANVKGVFCLGATHIPERIDEQGKPYQMYCRRCRLCYF